MEPAGYVVMRHSPRMDRSPDSSDRWLSRIPEDYARLTLSRPPQSATVEGDPNCLAVLEDFRSLMPLTQDARKPMFPLKPADGAFGGHQHAVLECYSAFRALTAGLLKRTGVRA